ncbi:hypothetical protein [uncultured Algibacter sp.]|uniref:hypothetical protein n=1 Tax=uncultured Algibacter sp. TaxID=298659 RepID=UPI0026028022|nr:hypothetical protein [uncultured Algibacter sp.]
MIKLNLQAVKKNLKILFLVFPFFIGLTLQAQLGFCTGNSGDPIFIEDFGAGKGDVKIPSGTTTYKFTKGLPADGTYKVSSNSDYFGWFSEGDHTSGDISGRSLIVNASYKPGEFFKTPISGLCENTTYEFSAWLINIFPSYNTPCGFFKNGSALPINVTFEIWDSSGTTLLKSGDTDDIYGTNTPNWQEYGLVFKTKSGQTSVILKMRNNGRGGCGNDLAIDDIVFKTCGDAVIIKDEVKKTTNISLYKNELPYSTKLSATPDFSVFSEHYYQWQESSNGLDWINIEGENNNSVSVNNINSTSYYRVLIAEGVTNLLNSLCNSASEIFKVNILSTENPNKVKKPVPKPQPKQEKRTTTLIRLSPMGVTAIQNESVKNIDSLTKDIKRTFKALKEGPKTRKQVIIVKNGRHIIYDKVWIDGAVGKFVQTEEKIIKQGDAFTDTIVEETLYYKTTYGYNLIKRTYTIKVKL